MGDVLLLAHRIPYPPDKGDKIRSYYLLRQLAAENRVHLACFIDDPDDARHIDSVRRFCASTCFEALNPRIARLKSASGFLHGQALSIPYYASRRMQRWTRRTLARYPDAVVIAYSSPMAQYVMGSEAAGHRRIMDFVDVDSDKWLQYAQQTRWPMRWVYEREANKLADFERRVAEIFDAVTFVSRNEVELFDRISPGTRARHWAVNNGVAADYFDPSKEFPNPYADGISPLVFTGMMDYWPNVDAMCWFARDVLPLLRAENPAAELWVVGASPTPEVTALEALDGVHVTGRVADVRPYLKHAALAVAPLRIARGVQNKVLEALAMGCTVLCTPQAAAGLHQHGQPVVTIADSEKELAQGALRLLVQTDRASQHSGARAFVTEYYDWERNLGWFAKAVSGAMTPQPVAE